MRADAERADRNEAVRSAARSWREAGLLNDDGLREAEALYPDDRVRVGPVFRTLLFFFTLIGVLAAAGFVAAVLDAASIRSTTAYATVTLFGALASTFLTERQIGEMKRSQGGTEAATSFAALVLLGIGWGIFLFEVLDVDFEHNVSLYLAPLVFAFYSAARRWGYPLYGAFAALGLLDVVTHLPLALGEETARDLVLGVRVAWIFLGLLGAVFLPRAIDAKGLPPAQRNVATAALLVLLAGLYFAVDISSLSGYWLEAFSLLRFSGPPPPPPPAALRYLSMAATVAAPAALLAWGLLRRRRPVLLLGLLLAGVAGTSLRRYIHIAPLWVVLTLSGIALLAFALLVRRYLDQGEDRERNGFTADPPLEGAERARLVELIAATATLTPGGRAAHADPAYQGKGGDFGGAGSNSEF